eukprot:CAMPEP_0115848512 /NCGR_PEP_ID=MMETSP0287-20121206/10963_1 /TAXON_ID=412157 /ORGANISM="Chrysochromulina rotalis, Strain UIO044" /LENGTH=391 /DNA_ID=CAMNT_0003302433 /DNA_START=17 /DNA_END=1193 /DNA_ORIENTATION=+
MPSYSRVAVAEAPDESDQTPPPAAPPSRPPPSRAFLAAQRGEPTTIPLPSRPPPSKPLPPSVPRPTPPAPKPPSAALSSTAGRVQPPSVPRPSPRAVERLASADGPPAKPPSRPPPSRGYVIAAKGAVGSLGDNGVRPLQTFHAQVGSSVPASALDAIASSMIVEARKKFHQRKFEEALHAFQHCLAVAEKTTTSSRTAKMAEYGALLHNVASCLHCLGDFATAKAYYERALICFEGPAPSRLSYVLYGDVDSKRCEFVRERLVDIEFGRLPDLDKYLDGYGKRRDVTPDLARDQPPRTLHMVDPFTGVSASVSGGEARAVERLAGRGGRRRARGSCCVLRAPGAAGGGVRAEDVGVQVQQEAPPLCMNIQLLHVSDEYNDDDDGFAVATC